MRRVARTRNQSDSSMTKSRLYGVKVEKALFPEARITLSHLYGVKERGGLAISCASTLSRL